MTLPSQAQAMNATLDTDLLTFGSDVALRSHWFVPASFQHPAKLHLGLLRWIIERYTRLGETVADPMAGVGGILYAASLQRNIIAREIEPRWLDLLRENAAHITRLSGLFAGSIDIGQADARNPWGYQADHIVCSLNFTFSSPDTYSVQLPDFIMQSYTPLSNFSGLQSKSSILCSRHLTQSLNQQPGNSRFPYPKAWLFNWQREKNSLHYSLINAISRGISQHLCRLFCCYQLHFLPVGKFTLKPVGWLQHCTLFRLLYFYQQFGLTTLNAQIRQQQFTYLRCLMVGSLKKVQHSAPCQTWFIHSDATAETFLEKIRYLWCYLLQANLGTIVSANCFTPFTLIICRFLYRKVPISIHCSGQIGQYVSVYHIIFSPHRYVPVGTTILDPMAGSGSILFAALQQRNVIAYEIEPRWINLIQANATHIRQNPGLFLGEITVEPMDAGQTCPHLVDCVLCSPPYGNEASATPDGRRMLPYRLHHPTISYDRGFQHLANHPTPGAMGAVTFHYGTHPNQIGHFRGERYWQAMRLIYTQASVSLRQHGYLVLIVKDHIREGKRVATAATTISLCKELGFKLHAHHQRHLHNLSRLPAQAEGTRGASR